MVNPDADKTPITYGDPVYLFGLGVKSEVERELDRMVKEIIAAEDEIAKSQINKISEQTTERCCGCGGCERGGAK